jgi:hypothetical protein
MRKTTETPTPMPTTPRELPDTDLEAARGGDSATPKTSKSRPLTGFYDIQAGEMENGN